MSCINKNLQEWKNLSNRYGDFIAELIVRGHLRNKNINEESDDFYIPDLAETNLILKSKIPNAAKRKLTNALDINPYLSEKAIASYLIGFIHRDRDYNNDYVINVGNKNGNTFAKKDIFQPSVNLLRSLVELYPKVLKMERTFDGNTFKVFITPQEEPVQKDLFRSPSMQTVLDTFKQLTDELGYQPEIFDIENQRWIEAGPNSYNLINKNTGTVVGNAINLITGVEQEQESTPIDEDEAQIRIMEILELAENEGFAMYAAKEGYDLNVIVQNIREATTQEELDAQVVKVINLFC